MKYLSLLALAVLISCSNAEESNYAKDLPTSYEYEVGGEMDMVEEVMIADNFEPPAPPTSEQAPKIIKNASLRYEAKDLQATHQQILNLTQSFKGMITSDNSGKTYNQLYRNLSVRIPTQNFQQFIDGVSQGVAYFDRKDITQQDVSEEFVDIEARLKAKRELEKRYLELLKQAKNVKEMLEIERELSSIREEIEAKQGRLNYLQNKVSLSTVNIEIYKYTAETGVTVSYGQKILNSFQEGWNGISVFLLGILSIWPLLLVLIIAILVIRRYLRKKRAKANK